MSGTAAAAQRRGANAVLWASCLAMLAIGINGTAIMAALPIMRMELPLDAAGVEWAVNAYLIVSAACIVVGGAAAGRFGPSLVATAGVALFAAGSCLTALAGSQSVLLGGRALQGLAAAFAVPATLAAVSGEAVPARRASAIGAWTGFLMLGFSVGPLVGGVLIHVANWRFIFWLNVVLMLPAMVGLAGAGGASAAARRAPAGQADLAGFVLMATFMVALLFGLHGLPHAGPAPLAAIGPLVLAVVALGALLIVESRAAAPLIDLRLFLRRNFVLGLSIGSLAMAVILTLLLFYNLYAQGSAGPRLSAMAAGASLVPLGAALLAVALSASVLTARFGPRAAMTAGMALVVAASVILAAATAGGGTFVLVIGFIVMGAGLALPYASASRLALGALSQEQAGQGSGILNACTFLGGSIGVAVGVIAFGFGGFPVVLGMIAVAGLVGLGLSRMIARRV